MWSANTLMLDNIEKKSFTYKISKAGPTSGAMHCEMWIFPSEVKMEKTKKQNKTCSFSRRKG